MVIYSVSSLAIAADKVKPCPPLSFVDSVIKDLMEDVDQLSRHEAKKLATKLILRQCKHEKEKGREGVRIRDGKVKFSEFSDTYNTQDPIFFCKNKKGYHSYLSQMTAKLYQMKQPERKEREYKKRPSGTSSRTVRKSEPPAEPMWNCVIPSYIKLVKRVNKNQMQTLTNTYGEASCSPAS